MEHPSDSPRARLNTAVPILGSCTTDTSPHASVVERVAASRRRQGLPERVEEPSALARAASLLTTAGTRVTPLEWALESIGDRRD